jgi:hypothetical protein
MPLYPFSFCNHLNLTLFAGFPANLKGFKFFQSLDRPYVDFLTSCEHDAHNLSAMPQGSVANHKTRQLVYLCKGGTRNPLVKIVPHVVAVCDTRFIILVEQLLWCSAL